MKRCVTITALCFSLFILDSRISNAQDLPLETLSRLREEYPAEMTPAMRGELLNRVAYLKRLDGWGLHLKTGGNRCPQPNGVEVSCDILVHGPSWSVYDVLIDENTPTFDFIGIINDPRNFVSPTAPLTPAPLPVPSPAPAPVPDPVPQPAPVPSQPDFTAAVEKAKADILAALAAHDEHLTRHDTEPGFVKKFLSNRYVQIIGAGLIAKFGLPLLNGTE